VSGTPRGTASARTDRPARVTRVRSFSGGDASARVVWLAPSSCGTGSNAASSPAAGPAAVVSSTAPVPRGLTKRSTHTTPSRSPAASAAASPARTSGGANSGATPNSAAGTGEAETTEFAPSKSFQVRAAPGSSATNTAAVGSPPPVIVKRVVADQRSFRTSSCTSASAVTTGRAADTVTDPPGSLARSG
jgi:hypothetical protein